MGKRNLILMLTGAVLMIGSWSIAAMRARPHPAIAPAGDTIEWDMNTMLDAHRLPGQKALAWTFLIGFVMSVAGLSSGIKNRRKKST